MKVDVFLCKDSTDCFCIKAVRAHKQYKQPRVVKLPVKLRSDEREFDNVDVFDKMSKLCLDSDSAVIEECADEEQCASEVEVISETDAVQGKNDSEGLAESDSDLPQQDHNITERSDNDASEASDDDNADLSGEGSESDDYDSEEAELLAMIEEELREKKQSEK